MSASNIIVEGAEEVNGVVRLTVFADGSSTITPAADASENPSPVVTTDEKAKVSTNDTTPGFLASKLVSPSGAITLTVQNPGANETLALALGTSGVIANGTHDTAGQFVNSVATSAGRVVSLGFAAPAGLIGGFEVVASGALDLTKGHHILAGTSFTMGAGTGSEYHTLYNPNSPTGVATVVTARVLNLSTGVAEDNFEIRPIPGNSMALQWYAAENAWIVKQNLGDFVSLAKLALTTDPGPGVLGARMIGLFDERGYFAGNDQVSEALRLLGGQGISRQAFILGSGETKSVSDGSNFINFPAIAITANSTVTLSVVDMTLGEEVQVVRTDGAAFTLAVINGGPGAGTMYTFPASQKRRATFRFDGTDLVLVGHCGLN